MLRFRLGSIPVEVHPTHLLVSALLGWMTVRSLSASTSNEWPYRQLQDPGGPGYAQTALLVVLAWMFIIFLSVLVHELGHALAGRMFGYRPSIELVWLGGLTRTNAPTTIPWHRMVVVTAAGPLAGLLLGLTALGVLKFAGLGSPILNTILLWFFLANLFWTLFNLLPVPPLDGGHIVSTVATRFLGRAGFIGAQGLALVVCIALVAYSVKRKDAFIGLFFGLYGLQAMRLLMAAWRGELKVDADEQPEPLVKGLQLARSELAEGRLETARLRGQALLESEELTPELASSTHHLLGWVALKDGQGRAALDHFSQVQREPVETHALAAAFSLVGDEHRALTLWELAWKETRNPTVMHEYAGSLIRADRVKDALKLPEVNPESAFDCAQRTLFIRGAYSEAARIAEEGLSHVPSARLAYDAACAHARARHRDNALRLLRRATELGFQDAAYAASDEDLASLHGQPDFEQWLSALRKSASA
ncbi:site-2 protease family protein [Archangium sp.]|uniref:site-2 protease family protein n=1 Tax=Archangium sp. TaxID=1872627 RepID=UPI00286C5B27|nr:site-2 protease family protein [Archangium sp.]